MYNQRWIYPQMNVCAKKLEQLRDDSLNNKRKLDGIFENLISGVDAEAGRAFVSAYAEKVVSIQLSAEMYDSEAKCLKNNVIISQQTDRSLADQIRRKFR